MSTFGVVINLRVVGSARKGIGVGVHPEKTESAMGLIVIVLGLDSFREQMAKLFQSAI